MKALGVILGTCVILLSIVLIGSVQTSSAITTPPGGNAGWQEVGPGSASGGGISNTSVYSSYPSTACVSDGACYVAWTEYRSGTPGYGDYDIYVRKWNGSVWEEVGTGSANGGGISNNSGRSQSSRIAVSPTGTPYVAWQDNTGGNDEIYVRRWNGSTWEEVGAGSATGGGISNNWGRSHAVSLAFDPVGMPYVAWHDFSLNNNPEIYVRRWNGTVWEEVGAGSATGSGISGIPAGVWYAVWSAMPSIAFAPDGTGYIAWRERFDGTGYTEIYVRRWNGTEWEEMGTGSASGVGISNTAGLSHEPGVAIGSDGVPYVNWHDNTSGNDEIYVRRWNGTEWEEVGTGSASGGGISDNSGRSRHPKMAVIQGGIPYVVWEDNSSGNYEIYARRWNGSAWEEVDAGSATGGGISSSDDISLVPTLEAAPDGVIYASWGDSTSGNPEIYVRRYIPNAPPVVDAGGPYSGDEGSNIALTATASDPDSDILTFSWGINTTQCTFSESTILNPTLICTDNGDYTVTLTVSDGVNDPVISEVSVQVDNVPPTVTSVTVPIDPVSIDNPITVNGTFTDPAGINDEPYTCTVNYGDATDEQSGTISGNECLGPDHIYAEPGVYTVTVTVTDKDGDSGSLESTGLIVIYDPDGGFVTGGGWIWSEVGSCHLDAECAEAEGKANFGFVSKYKKGASVPTGNTEFQFKAGDLNFHSYSYDWLVVAGNTAKYKGIGSINGVDGYKFQIWAVDGDLKDKGDPDTFRIKIWWEDNDGIEHIVYDNGSNQEIGGGNIVVHSD